MNQLSFSPSGVLSSGIVALPHLGVIRVRGADAARFLHGQLTQDFALLASTQARLAAYLTPKGRMLASFIAWQHGPEEFLLVCSRDLLAATLKRLSMFVLRAKAQLSDASAEFALYGCIGDSTPYPSAPPWTKTEAGAATVITLYPAQGQTRALWVAAAGTNPPEGAALDIALWHWGEVQSGVATLSAAVVDAFVPQMLNYESIDGIHFKKGCYPGQEVVARSQFRGTLKRRLYLAQIATDQPTTIAVGTEIFTPEDAAQPVGQVVQVAPMPAPAPTSDPDLSKYGYAALVVLQTAVAVAPTPALQVGAIDGPALTLAPLPYALREDI